MKKKWIPVLIVLMMISIIGGVYAYLTSNDTAKNTLVIGGVNTEVVEEFTPPEKLEPGTSFTKDVKVKNLGPSECYVRIKAVFTDSDMEKYCTVDFNTRDYVYNEDDGFYYYTEILRVGDITPSLFTTVSLSEEITEAEIKDFDILVYSEAYQSEGFDNYKDAWEYYHRNKPSN